MRSTDRSTQSHLFKELLLELAIGLFRLLSDVLLVLCRVQQLLRVELLRLERLANTWGMAKRAVQPPSLPGKVTLTSRLGLGLRKPSSREGFKNGERFVNENSRERSNGRSRLLAISLLMSGILAAVTNLISTLLT